MLCVNIYTAKIPEKLRAWHISFLEMLNILVAVRVWCKTWAKKSVKIHWDNSAVVSVLTTGRTKDLHLAAISRNIFMSCAQYDIHLQVFHIEGRLNIIVDTLSRWPNTEAQKECINSHLPNPKWLEISPEKFEIDKEI